VFKDDDDKQIARVRARLMEQQMAKRKRLNEKIANLKQQYRTINDEWQLHCARLDRISEPTSTRANRRNPQMGVAGFGDAVRSEAEFLEILASLESADMQDPNMRAARTTATAPEMIIDPDKEGPLKKDYDDDNGFVADPIAFYLSEFDPDLWSEEEKAIFAKRYALWPKQFGKI
ncbi:hypothetical protein IE53DRAFT_305673, partial [Violaceomyces palustris]